jgi:formimidoylglutamate deiminase
VPRHYLAPSALLHDGWADDVLIEVGDDGHIRALTPGAPRPDAERLAGAVIPGMPNVHSHAFQRAMAGLTQKAGPQSDSFWSWRELMYQFLQRITPDDVQAIATQLYVEMAEAGYTCVGEFHYLHHDAEGRPYANRLEMAERVRAAADTAGIGLTLLPALYAHSNFGGLAPTTGQRRFICDMAGYTHMLDALATNLADRPRERLGVAPHSLRAVTREELRDALRHADSIDTSMPIHIHIAEQTKEVDDCVAWSGLRPVEWLMENAAPNLRWCLVHATHMDTHETEALAQCGAVAGLCPTTEADLGDGLFNAPLFLRNQGTLAIGGDSHTGVDPFQELRLFEYGQRLKHESRNVLADAVGESVGGKLWRAACLGGAQALGQRVGSLAVGCRADWVVLQSEDAALAEQRADGLLDAAIFGPARRPVRDVMIAGLWQVREGRHAHAATALADYRRTLKRLLA